MAHTVLVVDADPGSRLGIARLLERSGYRVLSAESLADASRLMEHQAPDVVVTEVRLDGYNGLHLIATAPVPVRAIVITAYGDPTVEADARRFGAEYVTKPVDESILIAALERQLSRSRDELFVCARQNPRTSLRGTYFVEFEGVPARIRDVSYGGACLEMSGEQLKVRPGVMTLQCDRGVVPMYVAWERQISPSRLLCGVEANDEGAEVWRNFVDDTVLADARSPEDSRSKHHQTS